MAVTKVIRYKTHPESADENERLIRDVFVELTELQPSGLHYAVFRLDDGVSFLHVAVIDGETNPLTASAAFGAFQAGIQDRCVEGPAAADAAIVGSYQVLRLLFVLGGAGGVGAARGRGPAHNAGLGLHEFPAGCVLGVVVALGGSQGWDPGAQACAMAAPASPATV
jgi:hypothetical protein